MVNYSLSLRWKLTILTNSLLVAANFILTIYPENIHEIRGVCLLIRHTFIVNSSIKVKKDFKKSIFYY